MNESASLPKVTWLEERILMPAQPSETWGPCLKPEHQELLPAQICMSGVRPQGTEGPRPAGEVPPVRSLQPGRGSCFSLYPNLTPREPRSLHCSEQGRCLWTCSQPQNHRQPPSGHS